jgi:hypothetical protein
MSWDGSGNYSAPSSPGAFNPATTGGNADPTDWNNLLQNLTGITGLSNAICRDGQSSIVANIPFGGNRITGLGAAVASTDAVQSAQVQNNAFNYAADTGAADAYVISPSPVVTAYAVGQEFLFLAAHANATTTPTLAVSGLTAGTIKWPNGAALSAGSIPANGMIAVSVAAVTAGTPTFHLETVAVPPITNQFGRTAVSDAAYTMATTDKLIAYTSISTARTVTLPAANTMLAGARVVIVDESGQASASNTISLAPNGSDGIVGSNTTQVIINIPNGRMEFECNGSNGWFAVGGWAVVYTISLGSNVNISSMNQWFDGPSINVGPVGTFRAYGAITVSAQQANAVFYAQLWDGTTTIISAPAIYPSGATPTDGPLFSFSGKISAPASSIRISALSTNVTAGYIASNTTGLGKDSTLTVERIA